MDTEFDTKYELQAFRQILEMQDGSLMVMVDLYNEGQLSPEAMRALEAIEAMGGDNE